MVLYFINFEIINLMSLTCAICIVGTGYVGLVSASCLAEMGSHVTCVDINENIISALNQGKIHIYEPGLKELVERNVTGGNLKFTTSLAKGMQNADFIFIAWVLLLPKTDLAIFHMLNKLPSK
jgi:Predicted UDP-glucose 6-dehydrogenase